MQPLLAWAVHAGGVGLAASWLGGTPLLLRPLSVGPAWALLALKRLSIPLGTLSGRVLDRCDGREGESPRTVAGAVLVAGGVAVTASAT